MYNKNMEKIVINPIKVDLHIHSCFSAHKDKKVVKNCTIDRIPTLIEKIKLNKVDLFSITDHDYFSYKLYSSLKKYEGKDFKKILPGIEFTVLMESGSKDKKPIHIIAIFNDSDEEKVRNIEKCLLTNDGKIRYDNHEAFSENKFLEIIKEINLDVVLVAHQKSSVCSSLPPQENDATSLGPTKFNELLNLEYFEAYECKNRKNRVFNNLYALNKNADYEIIRFITGSDCHDWSVYPKHDKSESDNNGFKFTYLKCLPNFKGLALSFTDSSRIKIENNFFNTSNNNIKSILLSVKNTKIELPLSKGINAIIGDNSIGKSLLMNYLLDYDNIDLSTKNGYQQFLEQNNLKIYTKIPKTEQYDYDKQGEIRNKFKYNQHEDSNFLKSKFPDNPIYDSQVEGIRQIIDNYCNDILNKFLYDEEFKNLNVIHLNEIIQSSNNIKVRKLGKFSDDIIKRCNKQINLLNKLIVSLSDKTINYFEENEKNVLNNFRETISKFKFKYESNRKIEKFKQEVHNKVWTGIKNFDADYEIFKNESDKKIELFNTEIDSLSECIFKLLSYKQKIDNFDFNKIKEIEIPFNSLEYGKYVFIKGAKNCKKFTKEYFESIISRSLLKNKKINLSSVTNNELLDSVKKNIVTIKPSFENDGLRILKENMLHILNDDFTITPNIKNIVDKEEVYEKYSNGMNATIYFDIISEDNKPGIYAIDQPEDDVSQNSIRTNLISDFKRMATKRQVLLITHNPQFVVNLDADNVICLERIEGDINIASGALESDDILEKVANNLDGGIESIKKRWKKYDKE